MRLLQIDKTGKPVLTNHSTTNVPPYAILSHTWGSDDEEVTFADIVGGTGAQKAGYRKIQLCGEYAALDGLQNFWVDSCCIDKSSSSELSQAINSMFRWYQNAAKCYVYLSDVTTDGRSNEPLGWMTSFRKSRWFTRGWTLQELVAPASVQFLSAEGQLLGDKRSLEQLLHEITGIPVEALRGKSLSDFSRRERMLWAEGRTTKIEEDRAYSLLGIFEVYIPLIYGEGVKNAFVRLEEAIDKRVAFASREAQHLSAKTPELSELEELCLQSLWYPAMNARRLNLESPAKQTCCWLFDHESYLDWFHGRDQHDHHGLLWLVGNPGTGKSVLMKEAFRRVALQQETSNYCAAAFFFDAKGGELSRSALGLFRSLLYQLLPKHRGHLRQFCQLWKERSPTQSNGETAAYPWQEIELRNFIRTMFLDDTVEKTILFVDSLDEAVPEIARSQAYFWRDITKSANCSQVKLHVCFSSRPTLSVSLGGVKEISMEHFNGQDIAAYVDQRFTLGTVTTDPRWESLREKLIQKSSGIFLWAVLVVDQVLKNWDHGKNMRSLMDEVDRVPKGLRELYSQMLSSVKPEDKAQTIRLFQWATYAVKPLRLYEWHHIMAFIRHPAPRSLREWRQSEFFTENDDQLVKQIRNLSKGLIDVMSGLDDTRGEGLETLSVRAKAGSLNLEGGDSRIVTVIHESVREFFLEQSRFNLPFPVLHGFNTGDDHLSIMETCLDYLNIEELDKLVWARIGVHEQAEYDPESCQALEYVSEWREKTAEYHGADGIGETSVTPTLVLPPAHSCHQTMAGCQGELLATQEPLNFGVLSEFASIDKSTDMIRWLESLPIDHSLYSPAYPAESASVCPTDVSVTGQSQLLEDYPALLSYATFEFFTHAKLAEAQGAVPGRVVSRLQSKGVWSRWVALREDISQHVTLEDYINNQGLSSWRFLLKARQRSVFSVPKANREVAEGPDGRYHCTVEGCVSAPEGFMRRCEWSKHMDKHERPYRCEHAGCEMLMGFTYSGGLIRHEREVHGKNGGSMKNFNCPFENCKRSTGKGFSRRENLNEHIRRVHRNAADDSELHVLGNGGRSPRRQGSVASFSSAGSHTGNANSPTGPSKPQVSIPEQEHIRRGPYRCKYDGCEKLPGFTDSGELAIHQWEVHELGIIKKTLYCPHKHCKRSTSKGFSRQENLNEHIRRVHRNVAEDIQSLTTHSDSEHCRKRKRAASDTSERVDDDLHSAHEGKHLRKSSPNYV